MLMPLLARLTGEIPANGAHGVALVPENRLGFSPMAAQVP